MMFWLTLEQEKEPASEKVQQGVELDELLAVEKTWCELEQAKLEWERPKLDLRTDGTFHAEMLRPVGLSGLSGKLSDLGDLKLVPTFNESDAESFFFCV